MKPTHSIASDEAFANWLDEQTALRTAALEWGRDPLAEVRLVELQHQITNTAALKWGSARRLRA